jgi:hypothetical protein
VRTLLDQIEASLQSRFYFLSLQSSLTIPDIAGAMSSDTGEASGAKYAAWFEEWARPKFMETVRASVPEQHRASIRDIENPLTGDACYRFRCSLLHQGSAQQHPANPQPRIIFIEPGVTTNVIHYGRMNDALCIDLNLFCREMLAGARAWLARAEHTDNYIRNYERFARRHSDGLRPYIVGVPVVG